MLKDFFVFDTETGKENADGSIQWHLNGRPESFRFGVIYGHNFSKVIYTVNEFIKEFLHPRYKGKIIFAHNAEYDLNTIYGNIYAFDPNAIFNGKFISASNDNVFFADSTNIFGKIKLLEVGQMLGIKKPGLGNENLFSPKGITASEIIRCLTDCEIVYEGLFSIFTSAGDIKITQASLSMTYFRRSHQPHDIEYNENTTFFFDSYYGGRTEVFKLGLTHSTVIDVNSMYPYMMKSMKFPNPKYLKVEVGAKWGNQKTFIKYFKDQILNAHEGCAYITIEHKKTTFGFLPYKIKTTNAASDKGKLVFPTGRFSGCWNFPEIRFAMGKGAIEIINIEKIVYSQSMPTPFLTYVDRLYEQRLIAERDGNAFEKYRVKIFMNSLYGKFAQRIDEDCIYIPDLDSCYMEIRELQIAGRVKKLMLFNHIRNDAFLILHSNKGWTCSYSIPSFASYITSGGRVALLEKMLEYENRKIVYCDTDSVFFENSVGVENEYNLGGWKMEDKIVTEILGLKNYKYQYIDKLGNLVKKHPIKGIPEKADFLDGVYSYENLLKTKEALRRNLKPGVLIKRIKKLKGGYDKREVLSNGETKPIHL